MTSDRFEGLVSLLMVMNSRVLLGYGRIPSSLQEQRREEKPKSRQISNEFSLPLSPQACRRERRADYFAHPTKLTAKSRKLKNRQEVLDLVRGDLHPVVLELPALDLQKPRVDVLSEGLLQQLRLL